MIETILNICKYFKYKIMVAIPCGLFVFTEDHKKIVILLVGILIIDTILGTIVALKYKRFVSYKMIKFSNKIAIYGLTLGTAYLVSLLHIWLGGFFYCVGSYIIITEALSNFEKVALLGFTLPTKILSKLNVDFDKIYKNNGEKKEATEKILNKK